MKTKASLFALLGVVNFAPLASAQYIYVVNKQEQFVQTGLSTTMTNPGAPWHGEAQIAQDPQDINTPAGPNSITTPAGGVGTANLIFNAMDSQWEIQHDYNSQTALDTALPNGAYTFTSGGNSTSISLTGDLYPNTPVASLSVTNGVWNNGIYTIYAGQSITITTNNITGFTIGNFRVGIDASPNGIHGYSGIQFDSFNSGLASSNGTITIPGNEMQPGDVWQMELQFNAFATKDGVNGLNGGTNVGLYTAKTDLTIAAVPEPAEFALLAGLTTLGAAQWRRRRKA